MIREIDYPITEEKIRTIKEEFIKKSGLGVKFFEIDKNEPEVAEIVYDKKDDFIRLKINTDKCSQIDILHELVHAQLWFMEDWPVLSIADTASYEEKKLASLTVSYITEDPVVHRKIRDLGFNPISDLFFTNLNKDIKYFKNGKAVLDVFDKYGENIGKYFKVYRYICTHIILEDFYLSYGQKEKIKDFLSYFRSRFPELRKEAEELLVLYEKFDVNFKDGCKNILREALIKIGLDNDKIKPMHYIKKNNHFEYELLA